jgi:hypothetical protein
MTRIKSLYRSRGIYCRRANPYRPDKRQQWLDQVQLPELKNRLIRCCQQLDLLMKLRPEAKASLLTEIRKYPQRNYLRCPGIKSLRIAMILATVGTPYRFRTASTGPTPAWPSKPNPPMTMNSSAVPSEEKEIHLSLVD